jgi:hypothetical protein
MSAKRFTGLIVDTKNIPTKGFGFIKPDVGDENIYFHINRYDSTHQNFLFRTELLKLTAVKILAVIPCALPCRLSSRRSA